jgi:hypothetical protein
MRKLSVLQKNVKCPTVLFNRKWNELLSHHCCAIALWAWERRCMCGWFDAERAADPGGSRADGWPARGLTIFVDVISLPVLEKGVVCAADLGAESAADPREAGQMVGLHVTLHCPSVAVLVGAQLAVNNTPYNQNPFLVSPHFVPKRFPTPWLAPVPNLPYIHLRFSQSSVSYPHSLHAEPDLYM